VFEDLTSWEERWEVGVLVRDGEGVEEGGERGDDGVFRHDAWYKTS